MTGQTIAHYEITDKLGEGGMGVVYRAHDTKLNREVAVKVLPAELGDDQQGMARFEREAQLLASLNHPNIASIFGIEESNGIRALVMELVEGPTLADRIKQGPIPLEEALLLARQIAEALEYAHEKGIIHRDLKPANVKLTAEGTAKVLDFGLAKAMADDSSSADPAMSPTLTIGATKAGIILGTAGYMSPEQARGMPADRRADIWSFGVVLYEMLTSRGMFGGETVSDTLAGVLRAEIDLSSLPEGTPAAVRRLLKRCLERDRKQRLQAIGEARIALEEAATAEPEQVSGQPAAQPVKSRWLWPAVAAAALLAAVAAFALLWMRSGAAPPELTAVQFALEPPAGFAFTNQQCGYAVSPDGRWVVFSAGSAAAGSLWLRLLDSQTPRRLDGSEGGNCPTWSPDSRSLAFYVDGHLKRIDLDGGAPLTLTEAPNDAISPTGTWNRDGVILFGSSAGLQRVASSGGGATLLTKVDSSLQEIGHGYPQFLPDGNRFLYLVASTDANVQGVYESSLEDPSQRTLVIRTAHKAVYVPPRGGYPGYLLWIEDNTLVARRFNPDTLEFHGDPASIAEGVGPDRTRSLRVPFWASDGGLLAYFTKVVSGVVRPSWMDRNGKELGEAAPEGDYDRVALAPGAGRMAFTRADASGIWFWVREFATGRETKVTTEPEVGPVTFTWSPDGTQLAYSSSREADVSQIYRRAISGAGEAERLTEGPNPKLVYDWSRDGRFLLYMETNSSSSGDVMALPLEGDRTPIPVARTERDERGPAISPDGRWVAYFTVDSGSSEVWVQAFPGAAGAPEGRWQISVGGGNWPRWRGDGAEIYYQGPDGGLMAVTLKAGRTGIQGDTPRPILPGIDLRSRSGSMQFDVTPDGERFLVLKGSQGNETVPLTMISNWQARLGR